MASVSDFVPGIMLALGTFMKVGGNLQAGKAAANLGQAQNLAAQFTAAQYDQNAGQSVAASQRAALEERHKATLLASRALAVAGAGGGGVSDVSVTHIIADLQGRGAYDASVRLYQGEDEARRMRMAAAAKRFEGQIAEEGGRQKESAYRSAALGSLATGAQSMYDKYWPKGGTENTAAIGGDGNSYGGSRLEWGE